MNLGNLTPKSVTALAGVVSLCLFGGVAFLVLAAGPNGSPDRAAPLLAFLAPTIVSLLALARVESGQQQQADQHAENALRLANLAAEVQGIGTIATQSATSAAAAATASQAAAKAMESGT